MIGERLPTGVSSRDERRASLGWRLNDVPLNVRTLLLAVGLMVAIVIFAKLSYRIVGVGPTDMTLPALPSAADPVGGTPLLAPPPGQ